MAKWLTKSDYTYGYLIAPALLWIKKHEPNRLPPVEESLQFVFDQGHKLTELAQKKFAGGELIKGDTLKSLDETAEIMKRVQDDSEVIIYEPSMLAEQRLYARADIIKRDGDAWDMYEVKSGTGYHNHPEYLLDLAFQALVWQKAGIKLGRLNLVLVNSHYKKDGEVDPDKLFYVKDVTDAALELLPRVEKDVKEALKIIDSPKCPDITVLGGSNLRSWLPIYEHLQGALPNESIYRLAYVSRAVASKLEAAGHKTITEIDSPEQFELSVAQLGQWQTLKDGKPSIHHEKISNYLSKLKFPLYFLDYETVGPAVPLYDGTKPYQAVPFQYSIQIMDEAGGEVRELRYLHQGRDNPIHKLVEQLQKDIGTSGSVIVWSDYERYVHNAVASLNPEYTEFLTGVNARIFDLMQIFKQQMYVDSGFFGSASIKKVLPVIAPDLSYKDLAIGEGQLASLRWQKAATGELAEAEARQVFNDLLIYCGQDTMAMVRIYQFLTDVVAEVPKPAEQVSLF